MVTDAGGVVREMIADDACRATLASEPIDAHKHVLSHK